MILNTPELDAAIKASLDIPTPFTDAFVQSLVRCKVEKDKFDLLHGCCEHMERQLAMARLENDFLRESQERQGEIFTELREEWGDLKAMLAARSKGGEK